MTVVCLCRAKYREHPVSVLRVSSGTAAGLLLGRMIGITTLLYFPVVLSLKKRLFFLSTDAERKKPADHSSGVVAVVEGGMETPRHLQKGRPWFNNIHLPFIIKGNSGPRYLHSISFHFPSRLINADVGLL